MKKKDIKGKGQFCKYIFETEDVNEKMIKMIEKETVFLDEDHLKIFYEIWDEDNEKKSLEEISIHKIINICNFFIARPTIAETYYAIHKEYPYYHTVKRNPQKISQISELDFIFSKKIAKVLKKYDIFSMADLKRYVDANGMNSVAKMMGLGYEAFSMIRKKYEKVYEPEAYKKITSNA